MRDLRKNESLTKKQLDEWVASGSPLTTVLIDHPMKVFKDGNGLLTIDSPVLGLTSSEDLETLRVRITPSAVKSLKWILDNLEQIPNGIGQQR